MYNIQLHCVHSCACIQPCVPHLSPMGKLSLTLREKWQAANVCWIFQLSHGRENFILCNFRNDCGFCSCFHVLFCFFLYRGYCYYYLCRDGGWGGGQMCKCGPTVAHLEQLLTAQVNHALTVITVQCESQECRGEEGRCGVAAGKKKELGIKFLC